MKETIVWRLGVSWWPVKGPGAGDRESRHLCLAFSSHCSWFQASAKVLKNTFPHVDKAEDQSLAISNHALPKLTFFQRPWVSVA